MRQRFTRGLKGASFFTLLALVLAGCTQQSMLGWMPTERGLTNQVDRVIDLWVVSWVVSVIVFLYFVCVFVDSFVFVHARD